MWLLYPSLPRNKITNDLVSCLLPLLITIPFDSLVSKNTLNVALINYRVIPPYRLISRLALYHQQTQIYYAPMYIDSK